MPMNLDAPEKININFGFSQNTNESVIFEDIKSQNNTTDIKRMESVNQEESKVCSKQSLQSELLIQTAAPLILACSPVVETSFPCMKCEGKGVSKNA